MCNISYPYGITTTAGTSWASAEIPAWTADSLNAMWHCGYLDAQEEKDVRYLYRAYIVTEDDAILESDLFIAKDEVSAKVKALMSLNVDPDTATVFLQVLAILPAKKKD